MNRAIQRTPRKAYITARSPLVKRCVKPAKEVGALLYARAKPCCGGGTVTRRIWCLAKTTDPVFSWLYRPISRSIFLTNTEGLNSRVAAKLNSVRRDGLFSPRYALDWEAR